MDELVDCYLKAQAEFYLAERALIDAVKKEHLDVVMFPTIGVVVRLCDPDGESYVEVEEAGIFVPPTVEA